MMNWLSQHRLALGLILGRFAHAPFSGLLAMIVFGVTLSLPLGLYTLIDNVKLLPATSGWNPRSPCSCPPAQMPTAPSRSSRG